MKSRLISCLVICLLMESCFAALPGFYTGVQIGQSTSDYNRTKAGLTAIDKLDASGLTGRFDFGYQFDAYWAAEFGYARYSTIEFEDVNNTGNKGLLRQHSYEVVGKSMLPLANGLALTSKIGAAILYTDPNAHLKNASTLIQEATDRSHLLVGLGAGYDIDANIEFGCSWTRLLKRTHVQHIDFISLDFAYHFG